MWQIIVAQAQDGAQQAAPGGGGGAPAQPQSPFGSMWILIIAFVFIMYFLTIRPNQKREKERKQMLAALAKGDRVVTSGGICGTVVGLSEKSVVLRVDDDSNLKIEFLRGAIAQITSRAEQEKR